MGWQKGREGCWLACPDSAGPLLSAGRQESVCAWPSNAQRVQGPALPISKGTAQGTRTTGMSSPLTLGAQRPCRARLRCPRRSEVAKRLSEATFPARAEARGKVGRWPRARVPLSVPCSWAERDSWCCWYFCATASALRSCVCSS